MDHSDESLIAAYVRGGHEPFFEELVARHLGGVYSFALRLVGDGEAAQDLSQEIFVKAWSNLKKFDPALASFKTWLMRIARNACVDYLRKKRHVPLSAFDSPEGNPLVESARDEAPLPDEIFARAGDADELGEAVAKLSTPHREVLLLHYQEGLTFDEIGTVLGTPSNTVKSRHRRALHQLRGLLRIQPI